jgi:hypothetical protein
MTRDEFAEQYAARSMLSLPELLAAGFRFVACHCPYEGCVGWQAVTSRGDPNITDDEWERAAQWAAERLG